MSVEMAEVTMLAGEAVTVSNGLLVAEEVHDTYPEENASVTCTNATEIVNYNAHGFYTGDGPVRVSAAVIPAGYSETTEYWVIRVSANTLKLAASRADALAGTAVAITTDGTTVVLHWVTSIKSTAQAITSVDATANTFTKVGHGLVADQVVQVTNAGGGLPTGLAVDTDFYVIATSSSVFQLAATAGGVAINISDAGTGTQSVISNAYGPTEATVYSVFDALNGGDPFDLDADVSFRVRVDHRPDVVAYHLACDLSAFVPITAYVQGLATYFDD